MGTAKHLRPHRPSSSTDSFAISCDRLDPRLTVGLVLAAVSWALLASAGMALGMSVPFAPSITLVPADEVLSAHTEALPTGELAFREASGAKVRLITTIDDPEILNRGDGGFHPADPAVVLRALEEIPREFLDPLRVQIFILPYPRSGRLSSSADGIAIYLSPGVRAYEPSQVAFLVTHEIGHCVHRYFMPDSDVAAWERWAALRGVSDASRFHADAGHADRPHEIFAEDFRVLFGGAESRVDGGIENADIAAPQAVPGLLSFYQDLAGIHPAALVSAIRLGPNPVRPGQTLVLRMPDTTVSTVEGTLVDISGRVVTRLSFSPSGTGAWTTVLGSQSESGEAVASGAYWLRLGGDAAARPVAVRVIR